MMRCNRKFVSTTLCDVMLHHHDQTSGMIRGGYIRTIFAGSTIPHHYGVEGLRHQPQWQGTNDRRRVFETQSGRSW